MTWIKAWVYGVVAAVALAGGGCSEMGGSGGGQHTATSDFALTAPGDGLTQVTVETRNGSIRIEGDTSARNVDIRGTRTARADTQETAEAKVAEIKVEAKPDAGGAGRLVIRAVFPEACESCGVGFTIKLPPAVALRLTSSNGSVSVTGTRGEVVAHTSNASIDCNRIDGNVEGRSSNGAIAAREVKGKLDVKTSNGRITVEQLDGKELTAISSNGAIDCLGAHVDGPVSLRTANGSIHAELEKLPASPQVRAVSSNGSVSLAFPARSSARLQASTSNGSVTADLQGTDHDGQLKGKRVDVSLNGGTGSIEIETANAAVHLRTVK